MYLRSSEASMLPTGLCLHTSYQSQSFKQFDWSGTWSGLSKFPVIPNSQMCVWVETRHCFGIHGLMLCHPKRLHINFLSGKSNKRRRNRSESQKVTTHTCTQHPWDLPGRSQTVIAMRYCVLVPVMHAPLCQIWTVNTFPLADRWLGLVSSA